MAAFSLGEATLGTAIDLDGLKRGLAEGERHGHSFVSNLGGILKTGLIVAASAAAVGIGALVGGLALAVKEASASQEAQAQFNAVLEATGGVAGVTAQMANELASSLQNVTRFSDETVLSAETMLLQFKNISSEVFPETTELALDLATRLGTDAASAARMLGKALETPGEGLLRLKSAGVAFTDAQTEMILGMAEAGDVAGAQQAILDALSSSIGGAARAAGETFAGRLTILKNRFSDVLETIGFAVLPILEDLAGTLLATGGPVEQLAAWVSAVLVPALTEAGKWISDVGIPALKQFGAWFMEEALPAIIPFVQAVLAQLIPGLQQLWTWIKDLAEAAMPLLSAAIDFVVDHWKIFAAIGAVIMAVIIAINAPILAVIGVLVLLATAWANNWGNIQGITEAVTATIQNIITTVMGAIRSFWARWGDDLTTIATFVWSTIRGYITTSINQIQAIIAVVSAIISGIWQQHGAAILTVAQNTWNLIKLGIETAINNIKSIITLISAAIRGDWTTFGTELRNIWDNTWNLIKAAVVTAWTNITTTVSSLVASVKAAFTNIDWGAVGRNVINAIAGGISGAVGSLVSAAVNAARAAFEAAKAFLGIDSPSKLFEGLGQQVMGGMALGIRHGAVMPIGAMLGMTPALLSAAAGTGTVYNVGPIDARGSMLSSAQIEAAVTRAMRQRGRATDSLIRTT